MNSDTKYCHIIVFSAVAIIVLLNLGTGEVQPWDEGLCAIRASSIEKSHNYIDQASGLLGCLYPASADHYTHLFGVSFLRNESSSGCRKLFLEFSVANLKNCETNGL